MDAPLGEFLRARRELVTPAECGLPDHGRRRVPGLRREEVAMLAGISAEYYVRLERGRDRHPSTQVVEALARVLLLDADSAAYLAALAAPPPRTPRRPPVTGVGPGVAALLASMPAVPVVVLGRFLDVLAHNRTAALLHGTVPDHVVRHVFLAPSARRLYPDWAEVAAETAAALRASAVGHADDPELVRLVGELSLSSAEFRRLWARHDVRPKTSGAKRLATPDHGVVTVSWETLSVASAPGQVLVAYAPADEPARRALAAIAERAGA